MVMEIALLTSLSVPFIGPCMGRMLLGDDLTNLGHDILIAA